MIQSPLFSTPCLFCFMMLFYTGKCKEEGSSGGGDDAAELGIGRNFCAITYAKCHLHKSLPDVLSICSECWWRVSRSRCWLSLCTNYCDNRVPVEC